SRSKAEPGWSRPWRASKPSEEPLPARPRGRVRHGRQRRADDSGILGVGRFQGGQCLWPSPWRARSEPTQLTLRTGRAQLSEHSRGRLRRARHLATVLLMSDAVTELVQKFVADLRKD